MKKDKSGGLDVVGWTFGEYKYDTGDKK